MKKNLNKVLALTLAFTVVGSTAAYAEVMKGETTATPVPISAEADDQAEASAYISNTGKITEVADTEDGNKVFTMDNENTKAAIIRIKLIVCMNPNPKASNMYFCTRNVTIVAIVSTNVTAAPMPAAVSTFLYSAGAVVVMSLTSSIS